MISGLNSGMSLEELRTLFNQQKAKVGDKENASGLAENNKQTAEANKSAAESNLAAANTKKSNADLALEKAQSSLNQAEQNCNSIRTELQNISNMLNNPNIDDTVKQTLQENYNLVSAKLNKAEQERKAAQAEVEKAQADVENAKNEVSEKENELVNAENELSNTQSACQQAEAELQTAKDELDELEAAIEEAEALEAAKAAEEAAHISEEQALQEGYTILRTVADLQSMATNPSGKYILMNDIDVSGINWVPICGAENPFTGKLNGNGYSIQNLTITADEGSENVGFFGVTENAEIANLKLSDANISADFDDSAFVGIVAGTARGTQFSNIEVTGSVSGYESVGGVAGKVDDNSYFDGQGEVHIVGNSSFSNVNTDVDINSQYYAGGIVGSVTASNTREGVATRELRIENCHTSGNITISGEAAGGIIGEAGKTLVTVVDSGSDANLIWNYDDENEYHWLEGTGRLGGVIGNSNGTYLTVCNNSYDGVITADTDFKGDVYGWYMSDSQISIYDIPAGLPVDDILNVDGIDGMTLNADGQYEVTVSTLTGLDKMVSMIQQNPALADSVVFNVNFDFEAMDGAYDASVYAQYGVIQHIYEDENGTVKNDVYIDNEVDMETTFHFGKPTIDETENVSPTMVKGLYKNKSNEYVVKANDEYKTVNVNFVSNNTETTIQKRLDADQVKYRDYLTSMVLYYQEQIHDSIKGMFGLSSNDELPQIGPAEYKKLVRKLKQGKTLTEEEKLAMVVYQADYSVIDAFAKATHNNGCGMGGNASFLEADTAYQMKDGEGRLLFTTMNGAELVQRLDEEGNPVLDSDGNAIYDYADGSGEFDGLGDIYAKRGYQIKDENGNLLFADTEGNTVTKIDGEDGAEARYVYIDEEGNELPFEGDPETDLERQLEEYDMKDVANQLQDDMKQINEDVKNGKYPIDVNAEV